MVCRRGSARGGVDVAPSTILRAERLVMDDRSSLPPLHRMASRPCGWREGCSGAWMRGGGGSTGGAPGGAALRCGPRSEGWRPARGRVGSKWGLH